jgi:hypothetical protein
LWLLSHILQLNVPTDPRFGRLEENYSEDPVRVFPSSCSQHWLADFVLSCCCFALRWQCIVATLGVAAVTALQGSTGESLTLRSPSLE